MKDAHTLLAQIKKTRIPKTSLEIGLTHLEEIFFISLIYPHPPFGQI
jgi:hypothetical protein